MDRYFEAVQALQRRVFESQRATLEQVAAEMLAVTRRDGRILLFGSGHSHMLVEEGFYRAGGLAAVTPIFDPALMLHEDAARSGVLERTPGVAEPLLMRYNPQPGELLFVFSNSGVNQAPVEMALAARRLGVKVVAVLSRAYAAVAPLAPVGVRLAEAADFVIDNGGEPGDALLALEGCAWRVGPSSTVVNALLFNALVCAVAERLAEEAAGEAVPVFASLNLHGAAEHNAALLEKYRPTNSHL